MKPHIEKGKQLLVDFDVQGDGDFKSLAGQLKSENDKLIKSCTMSGRSHDELHKWLHPHIELIQKLSSANNGEEAEVIITKLKESNDTYNAYFQ